MTDELLALAARVEGAVGADRELDEAIWLAVTPGSWAFDTVIPANEKRRGWTIREQREASGKMILVPIYTASLDAAMTLVPEGCGWECGSDYSDEISGSSRGYKLSGKFNARIYTDECGSFDVDQAATSALALTVACLKASAALRARAEA